MHANCRAYANVECGKNVSRVGKNVCTKCGKIVENWRKKKNSCLPALTAACGYADFEWRKACSARRLPVPALFPNDNLSQIKICPHPRPHVSTNALCNIRSSAVGRFCPLCPLEIERPRCSSPNSDFWQVIEFCVTTSRLVLAITMLGSRNISFL